MTELSWLLPMILSPVWATDSPLQAQPLVLQPLTIKQQSSRWGLTTAEWLRYQQLKLEERGIWSPGLDPLTTLGVEATSEEERRHFAELLVKKEYLRVERELSFQRAYDAAWKRLYPDLTPIRTAGMITNGSQRLALFVRENCPDCDNKLRELLAERRPLDIYLVDSQGDDNRIEHWAQAHGIDARQVQQRNITLNHDAGRWQKYGQQMMPAVLQQQGATWQIVSP
ncbi:integrating conjugative element protein (TIGR03759 family) [Erwinia toletana]|uniref:Integrating conjugative element protein (TIGR03759 family) n=1 Tax=Winslowiella toletana TaxID=92490 RepID=A0ABS4PFP4_9GAMM|nr:TIGR03759 family integrating conjugative element protein [Winslowiella toletana]MBP2170728.1 integrating conjugative element protein (TIGR03759 family) [Winslowiella toletana]